MAKRKSTDPVQGWAESCVVRELAAHAARAAGVDPGRGLLLAVHRGLPGERLDQGMLTLMASASDRRGKADFRDVTREVAASTGLGDEVLHRVLSGLRRTWQDPELLWPTDALPLDAGGLRVRAVRLMIGVGA